MIYFISSAVLGFAVFSLITLHQYSNHLVDTLHVIKNISNNKDKVRTQIDEMESVIKYLKYDLKLSAVDIYSEISFFQRLDDIKTNMKDASIAITRFEDAEGEKTLPVQIAVPVKNYKMLVDYAGYIESFSIPPAFRIKDFSISRDPKGDFVFNIRGALRAPVINR
ncbi:MAG: hypothetical protein Q8N09_05385 [Thermodesulfovibrionia bacterium]|nr:hypothetical protein [Thermodesulfovibrionia bacterium]